MSALRLVLVSSALLFVVVAGFLHPASATDDATDQTSDAVRSLLISEFYPCAVNGDEYLVLSNCGLEAVSLAGWSITDGEGVMLILAGSVPAGDELSFSENASSFLHAYEGRDCVQFAGWESGDTVQVSGDFRLADAGDTIELVSPDGVVMDAVVYGSAVPPPFGWSGPAVPALREGEVVHRTGGPSFQDTDTSLDWMPFREYRYGYSDHHGVARTVDAGCVSAFTSPDCSLDSVLATLSGAIDSVRLCSYEMSSASVCRALVDASSRGVEVRVLVDAMPVGGMSVAEVACLSAMFIEGVKVMVVGGNLDDDIVRHVGALHSKYIVVDGESLLALSENFVEEGVPVDEVFGNRGWGVRVSDAAIGAYMSSVFDDDSRLDRSDVWSWGDDPRFDVDAPLPEAEVSTHPVGILAPLHTSTTADVSLWLSPDASVACPFIVPMISSSDDVTFEQLQADMAWSTRWSEGSVTNPVVEAVGEVVRGGGAARGLFDASWYNLETNLEAVSYLSSVALDAGSISSFGLILDESPVTTLHNKGLVLGDKCVVSSNNWVYASFARNRELAVVVRNEEVSSYFSKAFELDWVPDTVAPFADAGPDVVMDMPGECVLDASSSWDDRGVATIVWDLDGDGIPEAEGGSVTYHFSSTGRFIVWVEVTDAWGNSAVDSVEVVVGTSSADVGVGVDAPAFVPWPLPAVLSVAAVGVWAARKLNLLRQSSSGEG